MNKMSPASRVKSCDEMKQQQWGATAADDNATAAVVCVTVRVTKQNSLWHELDQFKKLSLSILLSSVLSILLFNVYICAVQTAAAAAAVCTDVFSEVYDDAPAL